MRVLQEVIMIQQAFLARCVIERRKAWLTQAYLAADRMGEQNPVIRWHGEFDINNEIEKFILSKLKTNQRI
jgi:hypothetical protein